MSLEGWNEASSLPFLFNNGEITSLLSAKKKFQMITKAGRASQKRCPFWVAILQCGRCTNPTKGTWKGERSFVSLIGVTERPTFIWRDSLCFSSITNRLTLSWLLTPNRNPSELLNNKTDKVSEERWRQHSLRRNQYYDYSGYLWAWRRFSFRHHNNSIPFPTPDHTVVDLSIASSLYPQDQWSVEVLIDSSFVAKRKTYY